MSTHVKSERLQLSKSGTVAFGAILAALFLCSAQLAFAATLRITPLQSSVHVGDTVTLSVYASSPDQALNAASGVIAFPTDSLTVRSVSKSASIISYWTHEPSFSNSAGSLTFEGVAFNPGYTGSSGKIMSISFKALAVGSANVTFSSGSVLANDGQGTNILTSSAGATIEIASALPHVPHTPSPTPSPTPVPLVKESTSTAPISCPNPAPVEPASILSFPVFWLMLMIIILLMAEIVRARTWKRRRSKRR